MRDEQEELTLKIFKSICPNWMGITVTYPGIKGDVVLDVRDFINPIRKAVQKTYRDHKKRFIEEKRNKKNNG